ncbi:MAG: hypothetical protein ACRD1L_07765, partial [Terriglobales bacterium]
MGFLRLCVLAAGLAVGLAGQGPAAPVWTHAAPGGLQGASGAPLASPLAAGVALPQSSGGGVLAAGDGGVWRFSGGQWSGLSDGQPVSGLTLSSDGSAIYAGTGDVNTAPALPGTGILKSTDGGSTWTRVGAATFGGLAITRIAADPSAPLHLLATAVSTPTSPATAVPGLYATTDGGATWSRSPLVSGNVWDVAWSKTSVLAMGASQIQISTDGGQSFGAVQPAGLPSAWQRAVTCASSGGGFLALFAGAPTPPTATLVGISADGTTAAALSTPAAVLSSALAMALAADAAGNIWLGGTDLWEFTAAQGAWTDLTAGAGVHSQQHAVGFGSQGDLWLANDGGLWSSFAGGGWQNDNAGLANAGVAAYAPSGGGGMAGLDGGGVAADAAPANSIWQVAVAPAPFTLLAGDAADPTGQSGFAAAGAQLWRWTGNGAQWTQAAAAPVTGAITALASSSVGLWLGSSSGQLLTSGDGGQSWSPIVSPAGQPGAAVGVTAIAVASDKPQQVWLASGKAIFQSANGGGAWAQVASLTAPATQLVLDPVHPAVIAAATAAGVWVSLDGGAAWTSLNAGMTA